MLSDKVYGFESSFCEWLLFEVDAVGIVFPTDASRPLLPIFACPDERVFGVIDVIEIELLIFWDGGRVSEDLLMFLLLRTSLLSAYSKVT